MQGAIDDVRRDLEILVDEGVDGVLFCNENDRPYLLEAPPVHVAAMARIVGELAPAECPFGVDYLWDARAALGDRGRVRRGLHARGHARRLRERHGPVAARRGSAAARAARLRARTTSACS